MPWLVWLRQRQPPSADERILQSTFVQEGLSLEMVDTCEISNATLAKADLVLTNAYETMTSTTATLVARLRYRTRAPIVILTGRYSPDDLVRALRAGADAIWTVDTPPNVLLAHCWALLRRTQWTQKSFAG